MVLKTEADLKIFFEEHYKSAVTQSNRIVNNLQIAEDITQDCIVKLWEQRITVSKKGSVVGYFKTMIRNKSIDHLRKRKFTDEAEDIAVEHKDHHSIEYKELSGSINKLIDSLPEKCRQVFVLSRFEQMSYKEISTQLDISPKTVENQISKALKVLRGGLSHLFQILFF